MYELFNFEYAIKIIQCRQVSQSDYSKPDYNVVGAVHYRTNAASKQILYFS